MVPSRTGAGDAPALQRNIKRLRRIDGKLGLQGAIEEDRYCVNVLTQTSSIQQFSPRRRLGAAAEPPRSTRRDRDPYRRDEVGAAPYDEIVDRIFKHIR